MKVALCAIAKNEDNYVNHWVKHYFDRGFDSITIYDNNDERDLFCKDPRVHIINVHGKTSWQKSAYTEFWKSNEDKFDWIAFFDLDEYLDCDNIKDVLKKLPEGANQMQIKLMDMSDSNYLHPDYSISPFERFKEPTLHFNQNFVKSIVKTNSIVDKINSAHFGNIDFTNTYFSNGKRCNTELKSKFKKPGKINLKDFNKDEIIMHHCDMKTIEEYLLYKFDRTDVMFDNLIKKSKPIPDRAFFGVNKKTKEKLEMLSKVSCNDIIDLILNTEKDFNEKLLELYRKIYIKGYTLPNVVKNNEELKYRVKLLGEKEPIDEQDIAEFYIEDGIEKRKSIGQLEKYFK